MRSAKKLKPRRLSRRWMRQDQSFPAEGELLLYDKPARLWRLISENETRCSNFEQNRSTKSQKAAGVRIVHMDDLLNTHYDHGRVYT